MRIKTLHDAHITDETLSILTHQDIFREPKFILDHPRVHVRVIISPEGSLLGRVSILYLLSRKAEGAYDTGHHLIQHRSETPPVRFETVGESLDNLRSEVLCRVTKRARRLHFIW